LDKVKALATEQENISALMTVNLSHTKENELIATVLFSGEKKGCLGSLERWGRIAVRDDACSII
jgi:hypothetical protein